jgi:hypothetical protein
MILRDLFNTPPAKPARKVANTTQRNAACCRHMAVIHIDADRFFLAVHARDDPSLCDDVPPVALYQYNDVICASSSARALGVQKHMAPDAARALLVPAGGRLVHAYWRQWPGPRIWCKPLRTSNQPLCPNHSFE